jgi:GMP synthase (glutamine-hydrolysing)
MPRGADADLPASATDAATTESDSDCTRAPRVLIVNLNRARPVTETIRRLERALRDVRPEVEVVTEHYTAMTPTLLDTVSPDAIILSPQVDPWWDYPADDLEALGEVVRSLEIPVLGICGGHQFLAIAFGGEVAPIEGKPGPEGYAGRARELGTKSVEVVKSDPIFGHAAVGTTLRVAENHVEEVKQIPEEFVLLARGAFSPNQAIRHRGRPIWGVQFHPESHVTAERTGRVVLKEFLGLVGRCGGTERQLPNSQENGL